MPGSFMIFFSCRVYQSLYFVVSVRLKENMLDQKCMERDEETDVLDWKRHGEIDEMIQ
jgi:hypothetical protein